MGCFFFSSLMADVQTPYQYAWWSLDALADVIYAIDAVVKFRTEVYLNGMYHKGDLQAYFTVTLFYAFTAFIDNFWHEHHADGCWMFISY